MDSSWFTPTVLFCFLNLIIISIFINAFYSNKSHKKQLAQHDSPLELNRSSSLLARVKSINFSMKRFDPFQPQTNYEIHETQEAITPNKKSSVSEEVPVKTQEKKEQLTTTPTSVQERKKNKSSARRGEAAVVKTVSFKGDEQVDAKSDDSINRLSVSEEVPVEKKEQLTTTTSVQERKKNKSSARRGEAAVVKTVSFKGDEQVDAKADDFINRFKQQLKMQRIDSIKRYTQMLTGGGASSTN